MRKAAFPKLLAFLDFTSVFSREENPVRVIASVTTLSFFGSILSVGLRNKIRTATLVNAVSALKFAAARGVRHLH
jgi:hypothetical protein